MMNVNWILSDRAFLDPGIDIASLKEIGSVWGSWRTWRAYQTDNVICHDFQKGHDLIKRCLQNYCNLYLPNENYIKLNKPSNVKIYEGDFVHDVESQEEIVVLHLAASVSDIVLMLGFDFGEPVALPDRLQEHRAHNYRHLVKQAIKNHSNTQWVLVDHEHSIMKDWKDLSNLTTDTLSNVLALLKN